MQRIRTDRPRWSYDLKCKQWHRQHWNIAEHNAPFAACSLSHFLLCSCFFFLILPAFLSIFTKLFAFFFCSLYFICRRTQKKTHWMVKMNDRRIKSKAWNFNRMKTKTISAARFERKKKQPRKIYICIYLQTALLRMSGEQCATALRIRHRFESMQTLSAC